jgi:uncharacterized protein (TIGR00290 family)
MMSGQAKNYFCSWSGGKDSCLALYRTLKEGNKVCALLSMLNQEGTGSRAHHIPVPILQQQANSISIPLVTKATSWADYEKNFLAAVQELKTKGIDGGVFGDIDLQEHLQWVQRICHLSGITACEPLWGQRREKLLSEFVRAGFVAVIISVKKDVVPESLLGSTLNGRTISRLRRLGVDLCGEQGEYHTLVVDGPLFRYPIRLTNPELRSHSGYSFLYFG